jgi:sugar/nucleoside kinase (ribokinase family)
VVLALNLAEARQVAALLELEETEPERLTRDIREALGLHGVVVHSVKESCAVLGETFAKIKRVLYQPCADHRAGDNFNAGFSNGLMRGLPAAECLMLGTATAGYYVRTAKVRLQRTSAIPLRLGQRIVTLLTVILRIGGESEG